ncbi:MAG: hypothetical protein AAF985_12380 [Bacteroidota bacterium]
MNVEKMKEFFTQLFTSLSTEDSITVLFFLITSFLLGALLCWLARGGTIRKLKKELKKKEDAHKLLNAEHVGLREQYELKEADLKKAQLEAQEFSLSLNAANEKVAALDHQLADSRTQIDSLNQTKTDYANTIEDLNDQILGLKSKNNQIETALQQSVEEAQDQEELLTLKNDYQRTTARLSLLEEKINQLEDENGTLKTKLNTVDSSTGSSIGSEDLNEVKNLLLKISTENANLKSEIHSIKDAGRTKVVRMAEEEMQDVLRRLALLEEENKNLKAAMGNSTSTEPIQFIEIEEEEVLEESSQKRAERARQTVKAALGSRIKLASEEEKDDLQTINGIGPFIEDKLNDIGLYTFEQISQLDEELIETITNAIEFFPGRILRDDWVGQAKSILSR